MFPYGHTANLLGGEPRTSKLNSSLRCPVAECARELAPSASLLTALSLWPHTKGHVKWVIIGQGAEYIFLKGTGVSHRPRLIRHAGCVFSQDGDTAHTKHKAALGLCCGGGSKRWWVAVCARVSSPTHKAHCGDSCEFPGWWCDSVLNPTTWVKELLVHQTRFLRITLLERSH